MTSLISWSLFTRPNSQFICVQGTNTEGSDAKYLLTSPLHSVSENAVDVTTVSKSSYRLGAMNPDFQKLWAHKSQIAILTDACRHNAEAQKAKSALVPKSLRMCATSDKTDSKPASTERTPVACPSDTPKATAHNAAVPAIH